MADDATNHIPRTVDALGWQLIERCGGGEFGAHLVERGNERAVIKVWPDPSVAAEIGQSVALAGRVRERGQPVPRYIDVGVAAGASYSLQEWIDGALPEPLVLAHAQQLVGFLDAHEDAAVGIDYDRPRWWREWDPVAAFGDATGRLRGLADELADIPRPDDLPRPTTDVVHGDYHHRNLLVRGRRVVAVFDWEGAHPGDRRADLFKLAWWCDAVTDQATRPAARWLRAQAEAALDDRELAAHAADVASWNLDFFAREHPEVLDPWLLDAVERVLAPYWRA
jgi:Ser/Thr protein kinase RdoA (MazF antagonist)